MGSQRRYVQVFRGMTLVAAAALALTGACGGGATPVSAPSPTTNATAIATQAPPTLLASGRLDSIPTGTLFVNYMDLPQVAGGVVKHQHIAGFVYSVQGTHEMDLDGTAPLLIQPGSAAFVAAGVMHSHVNPGATANDWWFIGLRQAGS